NWHWFVHERITVSANEIGNGLQALPNVLLPYLGSNSAVRLVIVLGAAVLLLDAAAVIAFAPRVFGDARRAAAALPLVALAVVPSTLVRPQFPYLQGVLLFALLAAFVWGERLRDQAVPAALMVTAVVAIGSAIIAPRIDEHRAWVDYRAWAGTAVHHRVDTFAWNQSYGPLRWPRTGHVVMTVTAQHAEYWKAEDLDDFNGHAWVAAPSTVQPSLPQPSASAIQRWSQRIQVTIAGMKTSNVIGAGYAAQPSPIPGGVAEGEDPGTWVAVHELGPGTTYQLLTYSPQPSSSELRSAGSSYPGALANDRTLGIPAPGVALSRSPQVSFAAFHSGAPPRLSPGTGAGLASLVRRSPYGDAYALAQRLASGAATPYAFVQSVEAYLARGFAYNENPPVSRYPLATFLFKDKRGYCQQFSGAMAMLLRMGGVPARVATGFTPGTHNANPHQWVVTDINAHAWVEVWFPRYGWVRFDPTPPSDPALGGKSALPASIRGGGASGTTGHTAPRRDVGSSAASTTSHPRASSGGVSGWWIAAALAVLAAMAALLSVLFSPGDSPDAQLAELERALTRTRRPLPAGATLASLEQRFRSSPGASGYVRSLRLARFGGQATSPTPEQRRALRHELRLGLGFSGRWRALWALPPRRNPRSHRRSRQARS
ncbi:MAG: transglutaminaseTgpA domain-containing protein, partial [Solirubrobacteraceae bacterium]